MANPIQQGLKPPVLPDYPAHSGAAMANPIQQGLKRDGEMTQPAQARHAAMANPIQQGLKQLQVRSGEITVKAAMANPIQQGLKPVRGNRHRQIADRPQWLIQYNKD